MDQIIAQFISLARDASIPGAVIAVSFVVFKSPLTNVVAEWIRNKVTSNPTGVDSKGNLITLETIDNRVKLLATNHFHEVKESLQRIESLLARSAERDAQALGQIQSALEFIKGRMNGRNHD